VAYQPWRDLPLDEYRAFKIAQAAALGPELTPEPTDPRVTPAWRAAKRAVLEQPPPEPKPPSFDAFQQAQREMLGGVLPGEELPQPPPGAGQGPGELAPQTFPREAPFFTIPEEQRRGALARLPAALPVGGLATMLASEFAAAGIRDVAGGRLSLGEARMQQQAEEAASAEWQAGLGAAAVLPLPVGAAAGALARPVGRALAPVGRRIGPELRRLATEELGAVGPRRPRAGPQTTSVPEQGIAPREAPPPRVVPLYEMTLDELRGAQKAAEAQEHTELVAIIGDETAALKYTQLERRADVSDRAGRAFERLQAELGLTPEQLDRIDQRGPIVTSADVHGFIRRLGDLDWGSPEDLGRSLRWAITDVGQETDPARMTPMQQLSYAQIREAYRVSHELGWDTSVVSASAIEAAAARFTDPSDAAMMLSRFADRARAPGFAREAGAPPPPAAAAPPGAMEPTPRAPGLLTTSVPEQGIAPRETPPPTGLAPPGGPPDIPPPPSVGPLTDPILSLPRHREIVAAAEDLFTRGGVQRNPQQLISDQILEFILQERMPLPEMQQVLQQHGLGFSELGETLFRPGVRDAARRLGDLGNLAQKLNRAGLGGDLLPRIATADANLRAQAWWQRATNIWRGALVTQLATSVRNFTTQVSRLGLDSLDQGLQAGLQKAFRAPVTASPVEGMDALMRTLWPAKAVNTKRQVDAVLEAFPSQANHLFFNYSSDLLNKVQGQATGSVGDRLLTAGENAVHVLNTVNRFQEYLVRRASFAANLDRSIRATPGMTLEKVLASGKIDAIPAADVSRAVEKALELTFSRQPAYGGPGWKFLQAVNGIPLANIVVPFPRFMLNGLRFMWEFSPAGPLGLLTSKSERAALAAGDMRLLSRGAIGSAMLGAAYLFRESDLAGEKWYEIKTPDGRTIDTRAYNPFAAYLFIGDMVKRLRNGTLFHPDTKAIIQTLTGANLRAGAGLEIVDRALEGFSGIESWDQFMRQAGKTAGETVGGLLTPLQQISDAIGQFDPEHRIVRNTDMAGFFGGLQRRIPFAQTQLPAAYSPAQKGPLTREDPVIRQLTGVSVVKAKNPAQKELDRLQFLRSEIVSSSGNREFDNLVFKYMGELVDEELSPFVQRPYYRNLPDRARGEFLRGKLAPLRLAARKKAAAERPDLYRAAYEERRPLRERLATQERRAG